MNFFGLFFLLVTQFFAGRGLLCLFSIREKPLRLFLISMICGIMLFSLLPMLMEMMHIPITPMNTGIAICVTTAALFLPRAGKYDYTILKKPNLKLPPLYELFFIAVMCYLMIPSIWRCYYYPVFARDVLSGAEPLAEYAIKEHTLVNSVFTVSLESTNNHLKPPFITDLQIIYKMFVQPFGSVWLSILSVCFLIWLYQLLREKLHPFIACMLMLVFECMPDPYGYTYTVLYDYSNMVLFFMGVYFIAEYVRVKQYSYFMFACLLLGFATFIRSETLVLIGMGVLLILYLFRKEHAGKVKIVASAVSLVLVPFMFYYIWMGIFIKYYLPVEFDVASQVSLSPGRLTVFYERFINLNSRILFGNVQAIYGYLMNVFIFLLVVDAIFTRKYSKEAKIALWAIAVVWVGLPFLGALIPWFDFDNTTKRGVYKLFPLMVLYLRNSGLLLRLSEALKRFEFPDRYSPAVKTAQANVAIKKKKK